MAAVLSALLRREPPCGAVCGHVATPSCTTTGAVPRAIGVTPGASVPPAVREAIRIGRPSCHHSPHGSHSQSLHYGHSGGPLPAGDGQRVTSSSSCNCWGTPTCRVRSVLFSYWISSCRIDAHTHSNTLEFSFAPTRTFARKIGFRCCKSYPYSYFNIHCCCCCHSADDVPPMKPAGRVQVICVKVIMGKRACGLGHVWAHPIRIQYNITCVSAHHRPTHHPHQCDAACGPAAAVHAIAGIPCDSTRAGRCGVVGRSWVQTQARTHTHTQTDRQTTHRDVDGGDGSPTPAPGRPRVWCQRHPHYHPRQRGERGARRHDGHATTHRSSTGAQQRTQTTARTPVSTATCARAAGCATPAARRVSSATTTTTTRGCALTCWRRAGRAPACRWDRRRRAPGPPSGAERRTGAQGTRAR